VATAEAADLRLGIEPTSHLFADASIVHRLADATAVARKAGIGVIPDIFACWVDSDIEQAIADAGPLISLVQISDQVYGDRGLPCRAVPGDGEIPFKRLIPAFAAAGFTGYYDLEIIGPRMQAEGQEQGLLRAATHIASCLDRSEI
jgi:sugar phosphate isomerase/epimerase